jgi:hypothetical protein
VTSLIVFNESAISGNRAAPAGIAFFERTNASTSAISVAASDFGLSDGIVVLILS